MGCLGQISSHESPHEFEDRNLMEISWGFKVETSGKSHGETSRI